MHLQMIFTHNCSSAFVFADVFAAVRKKADQQVINCPSDNADVYNWFISIKELQDALA